MQLISESSFGSLEKFWSFFCARGPEFKTRSDQTLFSSFFTFDLTPLIVLSTFQQGSIMNLDDLILHVDENLR